MADELFDKLKELASTTSAPAGTCLFRQDEPSTSVYVVRSGNIALVLGGRRRSSSNGSARARQHHRSACRLEWTYTVTGKAIIDSEVGVISAGRVLELIECNPAFCRAAIRMMSQEVARLRIVNRGALQPHA